MIDCLAWAAAVGDEFGVAAVRLLAIAVGYLTFGNPLCLRWNLDVQVPRSREQEARVVIKRLVAYNLSRLLIPCIFSERHFNCTFFSISVAFYANVQLFNRLLLLPAM